MPNLSNPTDIARETLKILSVRRIAPTPDNYRRLYHEIAGAQAPTEPGAELALQRILRASGERLPALKQSMQRLEKALAARNWMEFEKDFADLVEERGAEGGWAELIRDLVRQWEAAHSGVTLRRKREGLERVLANFGSNPAALRTKIRALVNSWAETPVRRGTLVDDPAAPGPLPAAPSGKPAPPEAAEAAASEFQIQLRDLLAQCLELGVAPRLALFPDLMDEAASLAKRAREASDILVLRGLAKDLKQFWFKLEIRGEGDAEIHAGLLSLLRLLVDNISELVADDQWLKGQIAVVREVISHPVTSRELYYAERSFKDLLLKQGVLKHGLNEAKATLKRMMASFVDRLGEMSESTGQYHAKIAGHAARIGQTEDIQQLNQILEDLQADTKDIQREMLRSREELLEARKRVEEAEEKVQRLQVELEQVSEMVHEDHLTGALNRRGLEDEFEREIARGDRLHSPLSIAVLDVDHFKRLNDTLGHQAGDEALIHLVRVVKETLRPTDVIARYGGEEFVIILPDTDSREAVQVMIRLQRELTKKFFLHDNRRVLITFSAGVALRAPNETSESLIARADRAVYQAKQAGRNRVVSAEA